MTSAGQRISGTNVATAVLLLAAAVLLCTRLVITDADDFSLPVLAALALEGAFYFGIIYLWRGRTSLLCHGLGLPALFALRIGISAAAAGVARLVSADAPAAAALVLSPLWVAWATAIGFTVVTFYLVRGAVAPPPAPAISPGASRGPAKVMFEAPGPADAETAQLLERLEARGFEVIDPQPAARGAPVEVAPEPMVEGWISVPARLVLEQLPAGAEAVQDPLEVPLSVIMPALRQGEVRLTASQLYGLVTLPPDAREQEAAVVLPLPLVVQQIPDEVFDLPPQEPPAWLAVEPVVEEILFAKV